MNRKQIKKIKGNKKYRRIHLFRSFAAIFTLVSLCISVVFVINVYRMSVLPVRYFSYACYTLGAIAVLQFLLVLVGIGRGKSYMLLSLSFLISFALFGGIFYANATIRTTIAALDAMKKNESYTAIEMISLKGTGLDGVYSSVGNTIGIRRRIDCDNNFNAIKQLSALTDSDFTSSVIQYDGFPELVEALYSKEVDAIILNESFSEMICNNIADFSERSKLIYTFYVKGTAEEYHYADDLDLTEKPFIIYISGMDTRNLSSIPDTGNSDVNIVAVINPVTKQIVLINTPRDYFVGLYGDDSMMDKLTHAGNYGIDCSIKTLNALYDININYYIKVNFRSLTQIVDALGGISVNAEESFSTEEHHFHEGENFLNGEEALAFSRERYSFYSGDRQRGRNQEAVITGILKKAMSPSVIKNYSNLMKIISSNTVTSFSSEEIMKCIHMQLNDNASWNITSLSSDGSEAYTSTYTYGGSDLYVMMPSEESVNSSKQAIQNVLN